MSDEDLNLRAPSGRMCTVSGWVSSLRVRVVMKTRGQGRAHTEEEMLASDKGRKHGSKQHQPKVKRTEQRETAERVSHPSA